jgi:murein DD-endopeptidase MepM/ murein hydrolase activator NlpD
LYLRSLGAIFFQFNDLAGLLVVIGMLLASRMSLVLSFFGFIIGYGFYAQAEGDFTQLVYSYIGFNFILTAIAMWGFFVIPSKKSYLLLLVTIPMIAILISGLHPIFATFGLPLYSLPFNVVVLLLLYVLALRSRSTGIELVVRQQFSPEKNYYQREYEKQRFQNETYVKLTLPFMGEWTVSQGYEGGITHKGEWAEALDFDVRNKEGRTFRGAGTKVEDYFCYNLPVVAAAPGTVIKVLDGIDDNPIGEVNLEKNWGNSVIIRHAEGLFTKLSHLKKGSIIVKEGQQIDRGEVLAKCGSSGRSPEPHLHFQVQTQPYIGSRTIEYPFSNFGVGDDDNLKIREFSIPVEGDLIHSISPVAEIKESLRWIPGRQFDVTSLKSRKHERWEVFTDYYNYTYLYSHTTRSTAYFVSGPDVFQFTSFSGNTDSMLHRFYLAMNKAYYITSPEGSKTILNIDGMVSSFQKIVQDFAAPWIQFLRIRFRGNCITRDYKQFEFNGEVSNGHSILRSSIKLLNSKEFEVTTESEKQKWNDQFHIKSS